MKAKIVITLMIVYCVGLLLFMASSTLFVGGFQSDPPEIKYLIGMSQSNLIDPWKIAMKTEIEAEAAKYNDLRVIFTDAANDPQRQIEDIKRLEAHGIDLLIVSTTESEILLPVIEQIHNKIPVILLEQSLPEDAYTMFIGVDNVQVGKYAGEMIAQNINGQGNIIEIIGNRQSLTSKLRQEGFYQSLKAYPYISIITTLEANWMRDQAEDRMKEYVVVNQPMIQAIFAQSDTMAQGAYIANEKLRINQGIPIVGVGGIAGRNGGLELVKNKTLSGTVYCPTGGEEAIVYAMKLLSGNKDIPKNLVLEPSIIR